MTRIVLVACLAACGFTPGSDALSAVDGGTVAHADAHASSDSPTVHHDAALTPDAAPIALTLSETTSDAASPGDGIYCHGDGTQAVLDNGWFRAFVLSSFSIPGAFHVTRIHFTAQESLGGQALVTIYEYSGVVTTGATTLSIADFTSVASANVAATDSSSPQDLYATFANDVTGTFAIGISSSDTVNGQGIRTSYLHLGANTAGQSWQSYYASAACSENTITAQGGADFVIDVEGTY